MKLIKLLDVENITYRKPHSRLRSYLALTITILIITTIPFNTLGLPTIFNIPPNWFYMPVFIGASNVQRGDLDYAFQPAVISTLSGDRLNFKLIVKNVGNRTLVYDYDTGGPVVHIYGLGGIRISTLYANNDQGGGLELYLKPGETGVAEWTWRLDSQAIPPIILPGVYWTSVNIMTTYDTYSGIGTDYDAPGILTIVL